MEMYGVKILFKNTVTGQPTVTDESYTDMYVYYEESIRVFMADSFEQAEEKALTEYEKFRVIQDREIMSDFDRQLKSLFDSNDSSK